jgi:alanine racemase
VARPTVARVHRDALRHNLHRVRELAPSSRIVACVKANGYGHGLLAVAETIADGCDALAVATLEEALELRRGGISSSILLLEGVHEAQDWREASDAQLAVAISDVAQLEWLTAQPQYCPRDCWIKVDTGMHRLGIAPELLSDVIKRLGDLPEPPSVTVMTHFARADEPAAPTTAAQLECLLDCAAGRGLALSSANSAAILSLPASHLDWVRPGYMLYGGSPFADRSARACGLRAAMSLVSAVIALRDVPVGEAVGYGGRWVAHRPSRIATIAAGYGDGYPRHAEDGMPVLVAGQRAPLAGLVSMDMLTVDVTDLPGVGIGSEVELWGDNIPVDEVAAAAGTIGYELLAGMPARVPREYPAAP